MDPATILGIVAISLAAIAGITSCASCYRTEQYRRSTEHDTTTVDIENTVTDRTEPDGTHELTRAQHIRIDDADMSTFTGRDTTVETGRPNAVANTLAGAASGAVRAIGGIASGSPSPASLPTLSRNNSKAELDSKEDSTDPDDAEKKTGMVIIEVGGSDEDAVTSGDSTKKPEKSEAANLLSVATNALADGDLDPNEMRKIVTVVLGGQSDADGVSDTTGSDSIV